MPDLFNPNIEHTPTDKLKAVERELKYRRYVYPQRVAAGKMREVEADHQISVFEAIADDYRKQVFP